jgi:hypothetical protein
MSWKDDKVEHSEIWKIATNKALHNIDKTKLTFAREVFTHDFGFLIELFGRMDNVNQEEKEKGVTSVFLTWLFSAFRKMDSSGDWVKDLKGLTKDETDVLNTALKSKFDLFKIDKVGDGYLSIVDSNNSKFLVDTIDLDLSLMSKGQVFFTMIGSKANNKYFLPAKILTMDEKIFYEYAKHKKFKNSWPEYLNSFYKYQIQEGFSETTADNHTENVDLMLSYLEDKFINSFEDVTKAMLKTELKKFVKQKIINRVDIDKVYYSLYKFFDYLEEKKGIKNDEVISWLKAIT